MTTDEGFRRVDWAANLGGFVSAGAHMYAEARLFAQGMPDDIPLGSHVRVVWRDGQASSVTVNGLEYTGDREKVAEVMQAISRIVTTEDSDAPPMTIDYFSQGQV